MGLGLIVAMKTVLYDELGPLFAKVWENEIFKFENWGKSEKLRKHWKCLSRDRTCNPFACAVSRSTLDHSANLLLWLKELHLW